MSRYFFLMWKTPYVYSNMAMFTQQAKLTNFFCQVTFIYIALFTVQMVSKQL